VVIGSLLLIGGIDGCLFSRMTHLMIRVVVSYMGSNFDMHEC